VEFTGANIFFGKTASLLQGDDELGNLRKVLLKIVIVLVLLSFNFSGILFGYLLGSGTGVTESIPFSVVLIVASIPVAIEIVCKI
jgi:H+-transporting ATPase